MLLSQLFSETDSVMLKAEKRAWSHFAAGQERPCAPAGTGGAQGCPNLGSALTNSTPQPVLLG